jgi:hypothetical protein
MGVLCYKVTAYQREELESWQALARPSVGVETDDEASLPLLVFLIFRHGL